MIKNVLEKVYVSDYIKVAKFIIKDYFNKCIEAVHVYLFDKEVSFSVASRNRNGSYDSNEKRIEALLHELKPYITSEVEVEKVARFTVVSGHIKAKHKKEVQLILDCFR